jgi:threonine/homoserine/homoserine lactone efflux protein
MLLNRGLIKKKSEKTMDSMLLKGIIIGFSIAAPVGPIGLLCIRRTLAYGFLAGLFSGLGASVADAFYAGIAGFGVTFISDVLLTYRVWLTILGSCFLVILGYRIMQSPPLTHDGQVSSKGLVNCFLSTFFLTLTNPFTIILFMAVFAAFADIKLSYISAFSLIGGVFLGATAWWLFLSGFIALIRTRITPQALGYINKIAGLLIIGFAIYTLSTLVFNPLSS